ncbi:MAG: type II toxin-antitoxin system antitoxin DNA ADP-ribosyl glycohydrolase DarG [Nitrospirota bacterium]
MIKLVTGNLLEADAEAIVNTVNTVGIMGKGIALQFRQAYPENYEAYRKACAHKEVHPGKMFVFTTNRMVNPRFIINFPTKRHWKGKSRMEDIESGLVDLVRVIRELRIRSVAMPPLGCGNGGLKWSDVRTRIEDVFENLHDVEAHLYEPAGAPAAEKMKVATKRPNMTPGRASLIGLMERYAVPGYHLTLLEIQKLAYFLRAAGEPLDKLNFVKGKYGPYAEVLEHALQRIEGHFIRGYGDRSRFATIRLLPDALKEANTFLKSHADTLKRLDRVAKLIEGFESPYGMELLATVHWLAQEDPLVKENSDAAVDGVKAWSEHKKQTFQPEHIKIAWSRLHDEGWI